MLEDLLNLIEVNPVLIYPESAAQIIASCNHNCHELPNTCLMQWI